MLRNGSKVGTTSATSFTDNGLTVAASYSYTVEAFDNVLPTPNVSAASSARWA